MSFTQSNPAAIAPAESTLLLRLSAILRLLPTLLSAVILTGVAALALWPSPEASRHRAPPRQPLQVTADPGPAPAIVLVLVDGSVEAALSAAAPAAADKATVVLDASLAGEAAIVATLRELMLLEIPFDVVDLRAK